MGAVVHNFPEEATTFVGRQRERVVVADLIRSHRLVTLTGTAGSGKSRLALRVAQESAPRFRDGAWCAQLAALQDPALVPQTVAAVFGVQESPNRALETALVEALGNQDLLLVLDNAEHLVAACRSLAEQLMEGCPRLTLLVTSREPLACASEIAWLVPTLPAPAEHEPKAATAAQFDAVRLFVERAVVARPTFSLTDANAPAVAAICRQLDGIPLAIELAARRTGALTPQQMADRLADRFVLLTGGPAPLPRHQTLRAAIDWSYQMLGPAEQSLLARLSVFSGGCTLEAAEAVCSGDGIEPADILDPLTELIDKSLVVAQEHGSAMRYSMLETVRQFAAEHLQASGATAAYRRRHLEWFAASSDGMVGDLLSPRPERWLAWVGSELDNVRAAFSTVELESQPVEQGLRLAGNVWTYWWGSGTINEGRRQLRRLLELHASNIEEAVANQRRLRARLACSLGILNTYRFELAEALACFRESRTLAEELGDGALLAEVDSVFGILRCYAGDMAGVQQIEQGLALARRVGSTFAEFFGVMGLAVLYQQTGQPDLAVAFSQECLEVAKKLGGDWAIACGLMALGNAWLDAGELAKAHESLTSALHLRPPLGRELLGTYILSSLSRVACRNDDHARAMRLAGAAVGLRQRLGIELQAGEQAVLDADWNLSRQALEPALSEDAWRRGAALDLDEIEQEIAAWRLHDRSAKSTSLSARERDVASLVSRGLTNREIGLELGIAEGTAKVHVERIRDKLGFSTRAQIAAWAAQQGLLERAVG